MAYLFHKALFFFLYVRNLFFKAIDAVQIVMFYDYINNMTSWTLQHHLQHYLSLNLSYSTSVGHLLIAAERPLEISFMVFTGILFIFTVYLNF